MAVPKWVEWVTGSIEDKKQYRAYKARVAALPEDYREGAAALERYLLNLGPSNDGKALIAMLSDLAELLEQSVAAGTPLREVVGEDPADFADTFMENYGGGSWIRSERERLRKGIVAAEGES
jgi:DNA-binding ferritin-like protein (Dps family)